MIRGLLVALLVAQSLPCPAAQVSPISLTDLAGRQFAFPAQLPAERTLVLIAFRHSDQQLLKDWKAKLGLTGDENDWLEIPVIDVSAGLVKGMIRHGMRKQYSDPRDLAHVTPLFGDARAHGQMLGASSLDVRVMVIGRTGKILASENGPVSTGVATSITKVWHPDR